MEEKYKQLAADIETLRAANQLLLDKLSALKDDLQQIRADQARLAANTAGREDLKPLAQRIEEVDKKRQEDKDAISEEIKKSAAHLESVFASAAEAAARPPVKAPAATAPPAAEDGYIYTVQAPFSLRAIVKAYNDKFISKGMKTITNQQVIDANPGLDWRHLKVGQQIVIPHPPE
jgi:hypothetical protein